MNTKVLTPEQVKQQFRQKGLTFTQWAHDNGYHPVDVYRVTNGFTKASRGKMHEIAVKLGLKQAY
ncbi:DNA-binding protein [Gilliamella sp. B2776]|uniref:DNA-binding protein n=1 Tax=unclassified Gilliamella TaxID=2685620 RepID=UPI0022699C19|nr:MULTISPECIES: DNA-binding protein [unclassified Gilliamella]MCX8650043.1 DNA-binding protein [Gilliamella sp. B2779]MCX8654976.1 DNA-binding protein [Gilliamella sp. B2737]MCX8691816.1 DNA-binding protein [Gilliamella sp. B2776]MCX8701676.1 DNA-binding protein [Gilliamella sp. B2840]MCX8702943.1 DNA-binding protein [Gilliamella sp. B2781]